MREARTHTRTAVSVENVCVFITAVPSTNLFARGGGGKVDRLFTLHWQPQAEAHVTPVTVLELEGGVVRGLFRGTGQL